MTTWADLLQKQVERQSKLPHDFGAALDALRYFRELVLRNPKLDYWEANDNLQILEMYLYEKATAEEMHKRAEDGRSKTWENTFGPREDRR